MITFKAIVSSRTGGRPTSGPPGESRVLELNPQRREKILAATGWNDLVLGTLNLEVADGVVDSLLKATPAIREPWEEVHYPEPYANLPRTRGGYLYFHATLKNGDRSAPALIRRAVNPLPRRIEAFAETKLRDSLLLADGDTVVVEIA